jgi:hypothetical protein
MIFSPKSPGPYMFNVRHRPLTSCRAGEPQAANEVEINAITRDGGRTRHLHELQRALLTHRRSSAKTQAKDSVPPANHKPSLAD